VNDGLRGDFYIRRDCRNHRHVALDDEVTWEQDGGGLMADSENEMRERVGRAVVQAVLRYVTADGGKIDCETGRAMADIVVILKNAARGAAGAVALKERLVEGSAADDVCPHEEQFYNCDICSRIIV
jgi:hypothetical protein